MKNKKILLISSVLLTLIIIVSVVFIINKNDTNNLVLETKEQIVESNWFSMMYETGPGTGEYTESKSSLWPESGYIFNENLSGCENGGELSWNEELGAVNLKTNTSEKCYVYFDMYIIPVINSVTTSNIEIDSITLTVNVTNGNNPATTYYYSNNNGINYVSSNSNTYTFNGLDIGTEYNFSVYVEDSEGYKSEVYTLNETTDDVLLLADWVISQYNGIQGNNGIYYHTSSLANSAGDNSYRYAGANPNNYVCFGSNASTCPNDNLYRIIGIFGDEVKLIKSTSYVNGVWDDDATVVLPVASKNEKQKILQLNGVLAAPVEPGSGSNNWNGSVIKYTLNTTYFNTLDEVWQTKIATNAFKVGGMTYDNATSTPRTTYNYEVGGNSNSTTDSIKIGLMYVSDYAYAASPSYWATAMSSYYNAISYNWMYMGLDEWTISRTSGDSVRAFLVGSTGSVTYYSVFYYNGAVRPCFYLNSNITYVSGSGTQSDPIRIN